MGNAVIVGVLVIRWLLRSEQHVVADLFQRQRHAIFTHPCSKLYGYVDYTITQKFEFEEYFHINELPRLTDVKMLHWSQQTRDKPIVGSGMTLHGKLTEREIDLPKHALIKPPLEAICLLHSNLELAHCVRLSGHPAYKFLIRDFPKVSQCRAFVNNRRARLLTEAAERGHQDPDLMDITNPYVALPRTADRPVRPRRSSVQAADTLEGDDLIRQLKFSKKT